MPVPVVPVQRMTQSLRRARVRGRNMSRRVRGVRPLFRLRLGGRMCVYLAVSTWMRALVTPRAAEPAADTSSLEASTPDLKGFLGELKQKAREQTPSESNFRGSADAITLTAAVNLLPDEMNTAPSAKFLEAFRKYEKAKQEREAEKALREQRKHKPPS